MDRAAGPAAMVAPVVADPEMTMPVVAVGAAAEEEMAGEAAPVVQAVQAVQVVPAGLVDQAVQAGREDPAARTGLKRANNFSEAI